MRVLARSLAAALVLLGLFPPAVGAATPEGRYFAQAGGFAVTNADGVRFWDTFQSLGGVESVGYPVSRRFQHEGFVTQVMQKAVFQWRPETRSVSFVNVFDDLSRSGKDGWLLAVRSTPPPLPPGWDGGAEWAAVVRGRTALLDARPAIRRRYDATPDALLRFGLPTSGVQDMGNHYAARLQRAVIQEWKVDVPWARAGQVTVANGGDIMKEAGLVPAEATEPEPSLEAQAAAASLEPGADARVTADLVALRRAPREGAPEIARTFRNTLVEVTGPAAGGWVPIRLWNALTGWMPVSAVSGEPYPAKDDVKPGPYRRPIPPNPVASVPLPVDAWAVTNGPTTLLTAPGGAGGATVPGGVSVRLAGYTSQVRTWFEVQAGDQRGWVAPTAVTLLTRDPVLLNPRAVSGKGIWATYDLFERASAEAIVETAKANNLSHIYLQVGRSNLGYYGGPGLDQLLPLAHAHGIAVVGWVYPFLKDVTADVNMTMQAARHVTPGGHRIDALAADVEENMGVDEVEAYSQLVRAMLGDDFPLVVATYAPEQWHGRNYPFATVAKYWNVIAPMDYYRGANKSYSPDAAHRYVLRSIQLIRERAGRPVAIAPIGQAYGIQWPNETGPTNPSGDETRAMLRAAREGGAIGISFYQWSHATAPQWREIASFRWEP